jgi:hypothetical protein
MPAQRLSVLVICLCLAGWMGRCPICSSKVEPWARELRDIYNKHSLGELCDSCGDKADLFLNYWGEKGQKDRDKLFDFINSGDEPARRLSAMMNGGY